MRPYDAARDFEGMFAITRQIVGLSPYDEARKELLAYPATELAAFVETDDVGAIIGFCAARYPYWNAVAIIDYLVVAPEVRRRRIGEKLVRQAEQALRAAGMRRVCVQTIAWNHDGVRFYERLGYERRAALPGYFDDQHDLVWLDRVLAGPTP